MDITKFPSRLSENRLSLCDMHSLKLQENMITLNIQSKKIDCVGEKVDLLSKQLDQLNTRTSEKVDLLSKQLDQLNTRTSKTEKTVTVISDNIGIIKDLIKSEQNKIGFKAVVKEAAKQTSIYGSIAAGIWMIISNLEHVGTWLSKIINK